MKRLTIAIATVLSAHCGAAPSEHPITATCTPSVNVTIPAMGIPSGNGATPREQRTEVVQVYWDISRSMRDFLGTARGHRRAAQNDDLTPVVNALDSDVLLQAHARAVEQYGVGDSITVLPSSRSALSPNAGRTVLHLAAERIGSALADGLAQAAIVISDLELDTPPRTSPNAHVCGGVPLPSTPEAGWLFGRCFESSVLTAKRPARMRTNLVVHVFRKSSDGRELFILLLATDRNFGRRISDEIVRRIGFERQIIFDSGTVAAGNVRGCRLSVPNDDMLRTAGGCAAKCFDREATVQAECDLQRATDDAWVSPVAKAANGAVVRFLIPCTARPGVFTAAIPYVWRVRTPWSQSGRSLFAQKASVRDLFDSLDDAIVRIVAPRTLRIGIRLVK
jgi:uncharacterized membrane protein